MGQPGGHLDDLESKNDEDLAHPDRFVDAQPAVVPDINQEVIKAADDDLADDVLAPRKKKGKI